MDGVLNELVQKGYLDFNDGKFSINLRFLGAVSEFVDTPKRRAKKQEEGEEQIRQEKERKKNLENFQNALKAYDDEITFDVLKEYAKQSGYKMYSIVRNRMTELYIEGPWGSPQIAVERDLQTAVNKAVKYIEDEEYGW